MVNKLSQVISSLSAASIVMVVGAVYRNDCANGGESVTVFQVVSRCSCLLCEGYGVDADPCWRGSHCCRDSSELVNGVLSSPPWIAYKLVQNRVLYGVGYGSSDSVSSGGTDRNFYCCWSRGDVLAWGDSDGIRRNLGAAGLDVAERKRSRIWAERGRSRFLEWKRSPVVYKDNPKLEASTVPEVVVEALDSDVAETRNSDPMVAINLQRIAVMWVRSSRRRWWQTNCR